MLFVTLKGCAKVSIPRAEGSESSESREIWLTPTKNAVILAMDGGEGCKGHVTVYPSEEETHALQIIFGKRFGSRSGEVGILGGDAGSWEEVVGGGWDVVRDGEPCDDY